MANDTLDSFDPVGSGARSAVEAGLVLSQQGLGVDAMSRFKEGIRSAPGWHVPHFLLASEYAASGDYASAEACFAQTVLLAPNFHIARYQLGLLQFSNGRRHVAMITWAPLRALPPDQPYPRLVDAFTALMSERYLDARALFTAALPLAVNVGLEADIRGLMLRLDEHMGSANAVGTTGEAGETQVQPESPHHVLLSNYAGKTFH